jgi:hypothetical protein
VEGDWDEYDDADFPPEYQKTRNGHFRLGTGFPNEDEYLYVKPEDYRGLRSHLRMTVAHTRPRNAYVYPETRGGARPSEALNDLRTPGPGGQPKLFGMSSTPGSSKVEWLGGTKEGRPHLLTMLGIAQNRTQQEYGRDLSPSEDLSPYSSKLVGNLAKRGVLQGDVETRASNDIGFQRPQTIYTEDSEPIPASEVKRGKRTMARILKSKRKS